MSISSNIDDSAKLWQKREMCPSQRHYRQELDIGPLKVKQKIKLTEKCRLLTPVANLNHTVQLHCTLIKLQNQQGFYIYGMCSGSQASR